jgi:hypothetical protein
MKLVGFKIGQLGENRDMVKLPLMLVLFVVDVLLWELSCDAKRLNINRHHQEARQQQQQQQQWYHHHHYHHYHHHRLRLETHLRLKP